jgi:hypothetical protein
VNRRDAELRMKQGERSAGEKIDQQRRGETSRDEGGEISWIVAPILTRAPLLFGELHQASR